MGGEYDLVDDSQFDELVRDIRQGKVKHAKIISPTELGYSSKGVPVDLACTPNKRGSSIVWIDRWIRMSVQVTTNSGRNFILSQTNIGFVRRSTPLLILGKSTCTLCGYRTIRQQDDDRRDEDEHKHRNPGKHNTKVVNITRSENKTTPIIQPNNSKGEGEQDSIHVEVLHEDNDLATTMQYLQIATSDIPFAYTYGQEKVENEYEHEQQYHHDHDQVDNRAHWTWIDETSTRHLSKQTDTMATNIKTRQTLMSTTLEQEGKSEDGDNEDEASDDNTDEEDDEVHPVTTNNMDPQLKSRRHKIKIETVMSENAAASETNMDECQYTKDICFKLNDEHGMDGDTRATEATSYDHAVDIKVFEEQDEALPQYITVAASGLELEQVDSNGKRVARAGDLITDGYIYLGKTGHKNMETCS